MKVQLLAIALKLLVDALKSAKATEILKALADKALDVVEKKVLGTASTLDDEIFLPICDLFRKAFSIEDND